MSGLPRYIRLSVNVNKVATLRNSRGGNVPGVLEAVRVCLAAGAPGITVHPRADRRHITPEDVREIAAELRSLRNRVEFNIEGDPRPELLALVREVRPQQCTLVPVRPGEVTSQAGWPADTPADDMRRIVGDLQNVDIVMHRTFWVGVYPGLDQERLDYIAESIGQLMVLVDRH